MASTQAKGLEKCQEPKMGKGWLELGPPLQ